MKVSAQKAEIVKLKADGLCFDSIKKAPALGPAKKNLFIYPRGGWHDPPDKPLTVR